MVADDQVELTRTGASLLAKSPASIRGKLEVRERSALDANNRPAILQVNELGVQYDKARALDGVSLDVREGAGFRQAMERAPQAQSPRAPLQASVKASDVFPGCVSARRGRSA